MESSHSLSSRGRSNYMLKQAVDVMKLSLLNNSLNYELEQTWQLKVTLVNGSVVDDCQLSIKLKRTGLYGVYFSVKCNYFV